MSLQKLIVKMSMSSVLAIGEVSISSTKFLQINCDENAQNNVYFSKLNRFFHVADINNILKWSPNNLEDFTFVSSSLKHWKWRRHLPYVHHGCSIEHNSTDWCSIWPTTVKHVKLWQEQLTHSTFSFIMYIYVYIYIYIFFSFWCMKY